MGQRPELCCSEGTASANGVMPDRLATATLFLAAAFVLVLCPFLFVSAPLRVSLRISAENVDRPTRTTAAQKGTVAP